MDTRTTTALAETPGHFNSQKAGSHWGATLKSDPGDIRSVAPGRGVFPTPLARGLLFGLYCPYCGIRLMSSRVYDWHIKLCPAKPPEPVDRNPSKRGPGGGAPWVLR